MSGFLSVAFCTPAMALTPHSSPAIGPLPQHQFLLPGFVDANALPRFIPDRTFGRTQRYGLWLVLFPDADAERITASAQSLCRQRNLHGQVQTKERLHMTLHALSIGVQAPQQVVVDAALNAVDLLPRQPPMALCFDRVQTFDNAGAVALRCSADGDAQVAGLRQMLAQRLRQRQLRPRPSPTPHMTLRYGLRSTRGDVLVQAIAPLTCRMRCIALILSHVGATHHTWIRHWPLGTDACPGESP